MIGLVRTKTNNNTSFRTTPCPMLTTPFLMGKIWTPSFWVNFEKFWLCLITAFPHFLTAIIEILFLEGRLGNRLSMSTGKCEIFRTFCNFLRSSQVLSRSGTCEATLQSFSALNSFRNSWGKFFVVQELGRQLLFKTLIIFILDNKFHFNFSEVNLPFDLDQTWTYCNLPNLSY